MTEHYHLVRLLGLVKLPMTTGTEEEIKNQFNHFVRKTERETGLAVMLDTSGNKASFMNGDYIERYICQDVNCFVKDPEKEQFSHAGDIPIVKRSFDQYYESGINVARTSVPYESTGSDAGMFDIYSQDILKNPTVELPNMLDLVIIDIGERRKLGYPNSHSRTYVSYSEKSNAKLDTAYCKALDMCELLRSLIYERDGH